tara:strand:- start:110 stop:1042 length:933 start_codon:yes stop_codon:yes gene_type:complete
MYNAVVLADSINQDVRLTTMQITFPRFILAELNTHRVLSRSSASSRAIPIKKRIDEVIKNPFIPEYWGVNQKGMQAYTALEEHVVTMAEGEWLSARDSAVRHATRLNSLNIHKQTVARVLEPYLWHTAIVTATEWENFFALRISPEAQPEFRRIAELMRDAMNENAPRELGIGDWHLPFIDEDDRVTVRAVVPDENVATYLARISAARCARVSYLTHDGRRDHQEDLNLANRLSSAGHMSPFEHVAQVSALPIHTMHEFSSKPWICYQCGVEVDWGAPNVCCPRFIGNFRAPWMQYRKMLPNEAVFKRGD